MTLILVEDPLTLFDALLTLPQIAHNFLMLTSSKINFNLKMSLNKSWRQEYGGRKYCYKSMYIIIVTWLVSNVKIWHKDNHVTAVWKFIKYLEGQLSKMQLKKDVGSHFLAASNCLRKKWKIETDNRKYMNGLRGKISKPSIFLTNYVQKSK